MTRRSSIALLVLAGLAMPLAGSVLVGWHVAEAHGADATRLAGLLHGHHHDAATADHAHPAASQRSPRLEVDTAAVPAPPVVVPAAPPALWRSVPEHVPHGPPAGTRHTVLLS